MSRNMKEMLDHRLSALTWTPADSRAMMDKLKGEQPVMKRKMSAALVFALAAMLALTGMAVAAGLGAFSGFAGEWNRARLERLDEAAQEVGESVSASAAEQTAVPAGEATLRDEILANLTNYDFTLTLDKAYVGGSKLYYAYTLKLSRAPQTTFGEGKPEGFGDSWDIDYTASGDPGGGKLMNYVTMGDPAQDAAFHAWFDEREEAYAVSEYVGVGDGCDLADGRVCNIYDDGSAWLDETTLSGFQEVELPEDAVVNGKVDIVLTIGFGASVYYQNASGAYRETVTLPRPNHSVKIPVTIDVTGTTRMLSGSLAGEGFAAEIALTVNDVEMFGTLTVTDTADGSDMRSVYDYVLVAADGTTLPDLGGAIETVDEHTTRLGLRFDLPADMTGLRLRPDMPEAADGGMDIELK